MSNGIMERMSSVVAYRLGEVGKNIKTGGTLFSPQYSLDIKFRYIELITQNGGSFFIYNDRAGFEIFEQDFKRRWELTTANAYHEFWTDGFSRASNGAKFSKFRAESDYYYADMNKWLKWLKGRIYKLNTRKSVLGEYQEKVAYSHLAKGEDMFLNEVQSVATTYEDLQLVQEEDAMLLIYEVVESVNSGLAEVLKDEVYTLQENYAKALDIVEKEVKRRCDKLNKLFEELQDNVLNYDSNKQMAMQEQYLEVIKALNGCYTFKCQRQCVQEMEWLYTKLWNVVTYPERFGRNPQSEKNTESVAKTEANVQFSEKDEHNNDWGRKGEEKVQYQLKWLGNNFINIEKDCSKDGRECVLLQNKELIEDMQEYDHILVSKKGVYLIETKYYKGRIKINPNGNWIRVNEDGSEVGIESPIAQVDRHHMLASSILDATVDEKDIHDIICIAHDTAIIEGEEHSPIPVIKVDMLSRYIKEVDAKGNAEYDVQKVVDIINSYKVK